MTVPPFQMGKPTGFDAVTAGFALTRASEALDVLEARSAFGSATWCIGALEEAVKQMETVARAIAPDNAESDPDIRLSVAGALTGTAYPAGPDGLAAFTDDLRSVAANGSPPVRSMTQVRYAAERLRKCFREAASRFGT